MKRHESWENVEQLLLKDYCIYNICIYIYIYIYIYCIITQTVMKYCTTITNFSSPVTKFSHTIWSFLLLTCPSYSCFVHLASHTVKDQWARQCLQKHVHNEVTKHSVPLLSSSPGTAALSHRNPLSALVNY